MSNKGGSPLEKQNDFWDTVRPSTVILSMQDHGLTFAMIAQAIGVSRQTVRRWGQDDALPRNQQKKLLWQLYETVLSLIDTLTPKGIEQWFHARNRVLDGREPIAMFARQPGRVKEAADAFRDGAFT